LAIASLALAALACQAVSGAPTANNIPDVAPADTSAPEVNVPPAATQPENPVSNSDALLDDDFSNSRIKWGTGTDADSGVEYKDDALNFQVFTKNYIVWTTPNDKDYENIHMEVTVINNGTDSTTAFGLICNQQYPITDSHYYFAVTPAGQYAIAKAALAQKDVFLTNNDEWGHSDLIAKDAASYRLGADCGNGKLTLYVDGQEVDSVEDTTYTSGRIAIFAWSGEEATTTNVSFDDFKMTQLP
jgi:hypothetical protein